MAKKYDVIIIGAGIGGLTAGAILAKNGKKVLVLEKNPVPGGYAVNFKRKGFEFDASLHMMQGCNKGGITYNILELCGINRYLKFIKPIHFFRSLYPDAEFSLSQNNSKEFIVSLKHKYKKDAKGIDSLFKEAKNILLSFEEFQRTKRISSKIQFYLNRSCLDIFKLHIINPKLVTILSQLWGYFGLPVSSLSAYYLPFLTYDYLYKGAYYPQGGSAALSNALKSVLLKNQGEIVYNNEISKLKIVNGKVSYAVSSDGVQFTAKYFISNADANLTFRKLVGKEYLPNYFMDNLDLMVPSISAFQVYVGLDISPLKLGIKDYELFINPNYNLDSHYELSLNNSFEKCPFSITIYSNLRSMPKEDKTTLVIASLAGYDYWKRASKNDYIKIKESKADILINRSEKVIPNFRKFIKVKSVATPLTMERYTHSYNGAIYGWAHDLFQCGPRRSFLLTPIDNLHLAGAWTHPGGGISGVMYSGGLAAAYILNKYTK